MAAQPLHRRWQFWVAFVLVGLVLIGVTAFMVALSHDGGYVLAFERVSGSPDGPVYNLTDEQARQLPGDLPTVLKAAEQAGSATVTLTEKELARIDEVFINAKYI